MKAKSTYSYKKQQEICAITFSIFIFTTFFAALFTAFNSSGPIILGTELNSDGRVEYMCLGNDCENLMPFSWSDK